MGVRVDNWDLMLIGKNKRDFGKNNSNSGKKKSIIGKNNARTGKIKTSR
ncbi:hypothetical protein AAEO50_16425 [Rossellomorea oryzaecorticis]|uniref:Uncharacterized protein n=1 Tax=Rossellomorea oryzaecorticis TaxID=1396505 RepID=A0ABU9KCN1_9BACI